MPHVSRLLAASLFALTLTSAPVAARAQEAPAADPAAPIVLSAPPLTKDLCPDMHPIKGNRSGRQANRPADPIFHLPGTRYYAVTDPEECFTTAEDAEFAGYRAPLR